MVRTRSRGTAGLAPVGPLLAGTVFIAAAVLAPASRGPAALPEGPEAPAGAPGTAAMDAPGGYRILHGPVLGLAVEEHPGRETARLVRLPGGPGDGTARRRVLAEGPRERCEELLARRLVERHGRGRPNLALPTLGGKQVWADRVLLCGWRIQKNVLTGHHRLLDPGDVRRAWGGFAACRAVLEERRLRDGLRPASPHLVLLLHGLWRSKDHLEELRRAVRDAGFDAHAVNYPSTRGTVQEHSRTLEGLLRALEGYETVSFVAHSLGGLVVREVLARREHWAGSMEVGRVVLLGAPNRGSLFADVMRDCPPFRVIVGRPTASLTPEAVARLPVPGEPFGIIAGGTGGDIGLNPLLPGDDDGLVRVESARLRGAADFLRVGALHAFLPGCDEAVEATVRFLRTGRFRPEGTPARAE